MDYEKKHKEDLRTAKGWLAIAKENNNKIAIQIIENLFPELKESNEAIENGDRFLCIDTVTMYGTGKIAYIKDKEYISEMDNCITDEQGIKSHHWDEKVGVWDYFMKLNN